MRIAVGSLLLAAVFLAPFFAEVAFCAMWVSLYRKMRYCILQPNLIPTVRPRNQTRPPTSPPSPHFLPRRNPATRTPPDCYRYDLAAQNLR